MASVCSEHITCAHVTSSFIYLPLALPPGVPIELANVSYEHM